MVANKLSLKKLANIFDWIAKAIVKRSLPFWKHSGNCHLDFRKGSGRSYQLLFVRLLSFVSKSKATNLAESGTKYTLTAESFEKISIEQEDIVSSLFLPSGDFVLGRKQRFLQYMLHYLAALLNNKIEVQV